MDIFELLKLLNFGQSTPNQDRQQNFYSQSYPKEAYEYCQADNQLKNNAFQNPLFNSLQSNNQLSDNNLLPLLLSLLNKNSNPLADILLQSFSKKNEKEADNPQPNDEILL